MSSHPELLSWALDPSEIVQHDNVIHIGEALTSNTLDAEVWMQAYETHHTSRLRSSLVAWGGADFESFSNTCSSRYSSPLARADLTLLLLAVLLETPYIPGTPPGDTLMARMAQHPILGKVLDSLTFDTCNTLFPLSLRLFLAVLPYAPQSLTSRVPIIMVVVGRAIYWRDRKFSQNDAKLLIGTTFTPPPATAIDWTACITSPPAAPPPSLDPIRIVRLLLVAVYNAWPSNLIAFVRDPVAYLKGKSIDERYQASWDQVWEPGLLAKRAAPLLRNFHLHPSLIYFSSTAELADMARWDKNDPSHFVTRSHMLAHSEDLAGGRVDLFEDVALVEPVSDEPTEHSRQTADSTDLARSNEILRLEATFGDRIRKLYLYNIGKLHRQTLRVASDEAEIHGFVNRLKEQTRTITTLTSELTQQRAEASQAQQRHAKQHDHLYEKLSTFREERRNWQLESTRLRGELAESAAALKRYQDELAVVKNERFTLQNQLTEAAPKIQHLEDYEIRMKQLTDSQRLWDADVRDVAAAREQAESYRARIYELDTLLRAIRQVEPEKKIKPAPLPLAPPPSVVRRGPDVEFYIAIADKAKQKAELLERENLELRQQLSGLQISARPERARQTLWQDS